MSAEDNSKKRKIVSWQSSHSNPSKKLKLTKKPWFRNTKSITRKSAKPEDASAKKLNTAKQFATPSNSKRPEYNLKSLQNPVNETETQPKKVHKENNHNMNINTRTNVISIATEWSKLGAINKYLLNHVTNVMELSHPTMIQSATIPQLLARKDVLMKSETGSGKTLAYLIPIVTDLMSELCCRKDGCKVMIIAPTRELSIQIYNVCNILCRHTPFIIVGNLLGGEDKKKEKQRLRKGLTIVIGTPGRILDHLENTKAFKYDLISWFILDEADVLLRLGFEKFIKSIVRTINAKRSVMERCNVLVSATLDDRIKQLADFILSKHVFVSSEIESHKTFVPHTLKHDYICVKREQQSIALIGLLRMLYFKNMNKWSGFKVIIFMSTCAVVEYFYALCKEYKLFQTISILPANIKWFELRGDMTQKDRTAAFFRFCNAENGVLFCTDVASRGLDIPKVNAIVQFDPPTNLQDYIHRSGRTARIGKHGQTILFLTPKEIGYLDILKKNKFIFNKIGTQKIWNQIDIDYKKYCKTQKDSSRHYIRDHVETYVTENDEMRYKAKRAMHTFVKAYTTYPKQLKSIFYIKNLDFNQVGRCFFMQRETSFLRKGSMKYEIKRNRFSIKRSNMTDVAQKITKKRNVPRTISEFASV